MTFMTVTITKERLETKQEPFQMRIFGSSTDFLFALHQRSSHTFFDAIKIDRAKNNELSVSIERQPHIGLWIENALLEQGFEPFAVYTSKIKQATHTVDIIETSTAYKRRRPEGDVLC